MKIKSHCIKRHFPFNKSNSKEILSIQLTKRFWSNYKDSINKKRISLKQWALIKNKLKGIPLPNLTKRNNLSFRSYNRRIGIIINSNQIIEMFNTNLKEKSNSFPFMKRQFNLFNLKLADKKKTTLKRLRNWLMNTKMTRIKLLKNTNKEEILQMPRFNSWQRLYKNWEYRWKMQSPTTINKSCK